MENNCVVQEREVIVAVFKDFMKPAEFQERCRQTLTLVRETGITKILVDTSRLKVMLKENQLWIDEVWFPEAKKAGIAYMAFLVPEDIFGRISVEVTNRKAVRERIIQIEYFENEVQARKWLKSQHI